MILKTKYQEIVEFINPRLRKVEDIPYRDGFFLIKELTPKEHRRLEEFHDFVVVSNYFADKVWDRQEIIDHIAARIQSRRKPKFDYMSETEFVQNAKIFFVCGYWPEENNDEAMFELFKNINSFERFKIYFKLRKAYSPLQILYSVLTFIRRCHNDEVKFEVSPGYLRIINSKKAVLRKNFRSSLKSYVMLEGDDDLKVLSFISTIGDAK